MSNYSLYFSPTGGTKKVADIVANAWNEKVEAIDLIHGIDSELSFTQDDVCIFSLPSYGGRIPSISVNTLRKLHGNNAKAILVAVYGNRAIDDTLLEMSDILSEQGFVCVAGMEAVAEHSLARDVAKNRPDADDEKELTVFTERIKKAITNNIANTSITFPGNRPYRIFKGVPIKPIINSDICVKCGECESECPTGALKNRTVNTEVCISCMRCVSVCPQKAITTDKELEFAISQKLRNAFPGRNINKLHM